MAKKTKAKALLIARDGQSGGTNVAGDAGIDWLSSIVLKRLDATPTAVPPFGASTLRWEVDAEPPVRLTLGGVHVGHSGSMPTHPTASNTYRLIASAGNESRIIGAVTVAVLLDQCVRSPSTFVDEFLAYALDQEIKSSGNLYFRTILVQNAGYQASKPIVKIGKDRIDFTLLLGRETDYFPNPDVTIRASFGMTVVQTSNTVISHTELAAKDIEISVDISFPWYTYLIPAVGPLTLALVEDMAEDEAAIKTRNGIREFVQKINSQFPAPAENLSMHSVDIYSTDQGIGTVEVEFCPTPSGPGFPLLE